MELRVPLSPAFPAAELGSMPDTEYLHIPLSS